MSTTDLPNEQTDGYTLVPSDDNLNSTEALEAAWTASFPLDTDTVIATCQENGWDGAHVYTGQHGPIIGSTGHEDNYHGWIDARQEAVVA